MEHRGVSAVRQKQLNHLHLVLQLGVGERERERRLRTDVVVDARFAALENALDFLHVVARKREEERRAGRRNGVDGFHNEGLSS